MATEFGIGCTCACVNRFLLEDHSGICTCAAAHPTSCHCCPELRSPLSLSTPVAAFVTECVHTLRFRVRRFLRQKIEENKEGWVEISVLATFHKLKALTLGDPDAIKESAKLSKDLRVRDDGKVCSLPNAPFSARILPFHPNEKRRGKCITQ